MLKQRILTAAVLVPLFVGVLFFSSDFAWAVIVLAVTLVAWDEWLRLTGIGETIPRVLAHTVFLGLAMLQWVMQTPIWGVTLVSLAVWVLIINLALLRRTALMNRGSVKLLTGCIVLISSWWILSWMRSQWMGSWWVLLCMCTVWFADIGAYFTGKSIGKTRLAPEISPGKTVEGVFGGLIAALIGGGVLAIQIFPAIPLAWLLPTLLVAVLTSVCGDLYESTLKRAAGVKDSGTVLPGHGGVLDRIDALLGALPVFTAGMLLAGILDASGVIGP